MYGPYGFLGFDSINACCIKCMNVDMDIYPNSVNFFIFQVVVCT